MEGWRLTDGAGTGMGEQARGALEMTAAMTILGTIGWFVLATGLPAAEVVFWRCAFGAVTLLAICAASGLLRRALSWRQAGLAALGGVAIVGNWVLLFAAFPRASVAVATVVYNVQPFLLVALGALLFGERPGRAQLGWLALAFLGVVLIAATRPAGAGSDYGAGIALALGASALWAAAAVIAKRLKGTPPQLIALIQVGVGVLMLAPLAEVSALPRAPAAWAALVAIGVVHTGLVYVLMYAAVQKLPTHLQGALSFLYPVVAVAVDVAALGLRPEPPQILGAAAILLAAAAVTFGWPRRRRRGAGRH
jgi:drug/metabolite transporter (DMT)-like permease